MPEWTNEAIRDWVTVWHSEWAAFAVDRELHEAGQRAAALWADAALALLAAPDAPGPARPHAPPGAAPAAVAPDAQPDGRDAAIAALQARVGQLERRLAAPAPGA